MPWGDAIIAGVLATALTDVWQLLLRTLGLPTANWGLVGRWAGSWPRCVFTHAAIAQSPPVRGERWIGWGFHYVVGVVYAAVYVWIVQAAGLGAPALASALAFGAVTIVAPWFVMQPAMGAGIMASKTPHPWTARFVNATTHLTFGAGLYLGFRLVGV